jgi:hypothetical protein
MARPGKRESPEQKETLDDGRPVASAATWLITVRTPVPTSWVAEANSTLPSTSVVIRHPAGIRRPG